MRHRGGRPGFGIIPVLEAIPARAAAHAFVRRNPAREKSRFCRRVMEGGRNRDPQEYPAEETGNGQRHPSDNLEHFLKTQTGFRFDHRLHFPPERHKRLPAPFQFILRARLQTHDFLHAA
jgi:hypothetical protein